MMTTDFRSSPSELVDLTNSVSLHCFLTDLDVMHQTKKDWTSLTVIRKRGSDHSTASSQPPCQMHWIKKDLASLTVIRKRGSDHSAASSQPPCKMHQTKDLASLTVIRKRGSDRCIASATATLSEVDLKPGVQ